MLERLRERKEKIIMSRGGVDVELEEAAISYTVQKYHEPPFYQSDLYVKDGEIDIVEFAPTSIRVYSGDNFENVIYMHGVVVDTARENQQQIYSAYSRYLVVCTHIDTTSEPKCEYITGTVLLYGDDRYGTVIDGKIIMYDGGSPFDDDCFSVAKSPEQLAVDYMNMMTRTNVETTVSSLRQVATAMEESAHGHDVNKVLVDLCANLDPDIYKLASNIMKLLSKIQRS